MATRTKPVTSFKSNQQTNVHEKAGSVKVKTNQSQLKNGGQADGLHAALGHRMPTLPSDHHIWTHTTTVTPIGAHYTPQGEFGSVARRGAGQGVYSYEGAPNKKGDSPLGRAMNNVGEKSGYPNEGKPRGGGGKFPRSGGR